jgi:hypothetical protein
MRIDQKLVVVLLLILLTGGCGGPITPHTQGPPRTYSTNFPLTENPISEGEQWVNGGTVGLDWTDISTTSSLAIGHQASIPYSDATALLQTGSWGPTQSAKGTVFSLPATNNDICGQEVEMRLRSHISAHSNTGYEITFSTGGNYGYVLIVRWNGPLGDFTCLQCVTGSQYHVSTGDVISATISGTTINAYKNGELMMTATDSTFSSGAPGIGINFTPDLGCDGQNSDYGFTDFTASGQSL